MTDTTIAARPDRRDEEESIELVSGWELGDDTGSDHRNERRGRRRPRRRRFGGGALGTADERGSTT